MPEDIPTEEEAEENSLLNRMTGAVSDTFDKVSETATSGAGKVAGVVSRAIEEKKKDIKRVVSTAPDQVEVTMKDAGVVEGLTGVLKDYFDKDIMIRTFTMRLKIAVASKSEPQVEKIEREIEEWQRTIARNSNASSENRSTET